MRPRIVSFVISFLFNRIFPDDTFLRPAIASASSTCPFPATPATATISPRRTVNDTFFTTSNLFSSFTVKCCTERTSSPYRAPAFFLSDDTSRPTILLAISAVVVLFTSNTSISLPLFRIAQRSATFFISSNLCVIRITVFPASFKPLMILRRNSISCGVSTAVGSSKIKISASR